MFEDSEMRVVTPQETVLKVFLSTLHDYQNAYGKENVVVEDSFGHVVAEMRLLKDSQLIELTCLTDENKLVNRVIHFNQFDLLIHMPNGQ